MLQGKDGFGYFAPERGINSMLSRPTRSTLIACWIAWVLARPPVCAAGLPPGQHTARPIFHSDIGKYIVNFTPFEFDYPIANLTPGRDHDLWYSVGSSIEHIDAGDHLTSISLPYRQWIVSGVALLRDNIVFTAGQSGKIGVIHAGGVRYLQVVPREDFPDLRDIVVNGAGEMWFLDFGRRSIGYRAPSGRVVENPFPHNAFPIQMRHCMGKLWVVVVDNYLHGAVLYVVNENLEPEPYPPVVQRPMQLSAIACDRSDRLWISAYSIRYGAWSRSIVRLDAKLNLKRFDGIDGIIAPDASGGVWIRVGATGGMGLAAIGQTLIHIGRDGARQTLVLPFGSYYGGDFAYDEHEVLWLAQNAGGSPVAVTKVLSRE